MEKISVRFQVLRLPESGGLRIKTLEPLAGLYISSVNALAAQYYFERTLLSFIALFEPLPVDGGLTFDDSIDWQACIEAEGGEVIVQTLTQETVREIMRTEVPDLLPPRDELVVRWASKGADHICFITDSEDLIDPWIFEGIQEQAMKHAKPANTRPI